jgi:two-component system sensor histidine kinase KdpD
MRRELTHYALALLYVGIALAVSFLAGVLTDAEDVAAIILLIAVAISGWDFGLGPALFAAVSSFLALDWFFDGQVHSLAINNPRTFLGLLVYLLVATLLGTRTAAQRGAALTSERARRNAEAAVQARDALLVTVSHDLRTPLMTIKTAVSTLRDPSARLGDENRQQLLECIESDADELIQFVHQALTVSRLEAGVAVRCEWSDVSELVSAVMDRYAARLKGRQLCYQVPFDLPLVQLDAALIGEALGNLLANVAEHTPPGTPYSVSAEMAQGDLCITVADSGPGIGEADAERVFLKYERLNRSVGHGIGLGLAIARYAAEAHGGTLCLSPSNGSGAAFTLRVPAGVRTSPTAA